jgi:hypothetical protein
MKKFKFLYLAISLLLLISFSSSVNAELSSDGVLNSVYDNYRAATLAWGNVIQAVATGSGIGGSQQKLTASAISTIMLAWMPVSVRP